MNERAYKVASLYLALTPVNPTDKTEDKPEPMPEKEVRDIAKETIARGYPTLLGSFFRNLDIVTLMSAGDYAVKHYSPTDIPRKEFAADLNTYKTRVLSILQSLALEDKNSLIDQVVTWAKKNPESEEDDIATYSRDLMLDIKNSTRSYMRRILQLSSAPIQ